MSKELIQIQFDTLHRHLLLRDSKDIECAFLMGMLMGYRDTLNERGVEVEGVSDQWWFEHQRGPNFEGYMKITKDRLSETEKDAMIKGFKRGAAEVIKIEVANCSL